MTDAVTEENPALMFEWGPPQGEKFLITTFVVGSLLLHAVAFYVFRIIYPPAIAVLPPPARINLISANSEDGRRVLQWIEAEDPALASATVRPSETRSRILPKLSHVPSYMVQEPTLKDVPSPNLLPGSAPAAFPPGPVPVAQAVQAAWPKISTRVGVSDELKNLDELKLADQQFAASSAEPPESVRFRIAVNNSGEIHYCFRLNSSGDSSLDDQARLWLLRGRFASRSPVPDRDENSLTWGVATIEWGNDVSHPVPVAMPASP
ncbi:MAG TPA: hypothetical protein VGM62_18085 [Chthoniobacterales bacterium]|jgi:hypothetical protein